MAVVKNEGRNLREWIEFQRLMGAEQVYLYDNGSTDDSAEIVAPLVREGFVTRIPWATFDNAREATQRQAYAHALCNFGSDFRWMAFIDLDEFLFPVEAPDLVSVLRGYEDCPSICVPWFMFGFSGHTTPPPGLVIENYTQRAPFPPPRERRNKLLKWKSIVQPSAVVAVGSAHFLELASGITGGFDEKKREVTEKGAAAAGEVFRINHYYSRSRQEFTAKLNTARFTTGTSTHRSHTDPRKRQYVMGMIEAETVYDDTILRFAPALRARMDCGRLQDA